ncbi:MAG: CBS domain-containing protein [Euryarchaeota archaeon]|nr:CBS domain-containing protein [Euryarchaeota archaeon]
MLASRKKSLKYEHFNTLLAHDHASDFMSTPPITLTKDATMAEAKALMRDHRISGIPIVDEKGALIGLVTLENIIIALEYNYMGDPIEKHMVRDVVCLTDDMDVTTVIEYLMTYNYGRYPVIDKNNKVVGVITNGDLSLHILERLGNVYLHDRRRDEILTPGKGVLGSVALGSDESFFYTIDSHDLDLAGQGSILFKRFLQVHGLPPDAIRRASISLYEAEVNVVLHAYGKGEIRAYLKGGQVFILVTDNGPGIDNIELAMEPGYSTASDEVRARGFGAGMGLPNIKKYADKLVILSTNTGVKMEMVIVSEDKEGKQQVD